MSRKNISNNDRTYINYLNRAPIAVLLAAATAIGYTSPVYAATIVQQDVTTSLVGTVFMDDAATGGTDETVQEGVPETFGRLFSLGGNGIASIPGVGGTVTIEDFGFATSGTVSANDATSVMFTFNYLGADQAVGGGDDVLLGSEPVVYTHVGAGEYYVNFDTPIAAAIDGLGTRFSVTVEPLDLNGGLQETIRFKVGPRALEGTNGAKFSASGSFVTSIIDWSVDASGSWGTASNWSSDPNIPGTGGLAGGSARLGSVFTAPSTVTLDTNVDLSALVLDNLNTITITDGGGVNTLTLSGGATITTVSGEHEIDAVVTGSSGLTRQGAGTVTLSGNNNFTGTVKLFGGTTVVSSALNLGNPANNIEFDTDGRLQIAGTTLLGTARNVTMNGNGIIDIEDAGNSFDLSGSLTGTGNLTKQGDGALTLSNAATYDGEISVNGGTLVVDSNNGLGTLTGITRVGENGGTVELDGSGGSLTIAENFDRLLGRFSAVPESHIRSTAGNNTLTGQIDGGGDSFANVRFENAAAGTTLTINNSAATPAKIFDEADEDVRFVFQGTGDIQIGNQATPGSGRIVGSSVDVVVQMTDPTDTVTIATAQASSDTTNATGSYWGGTTIVESGTLAVVDDGANNGELHSTRIDVRNGATFDISGFASNYSLQVVQDPDNIPFNGDEIGQVLTGAGTINTGSATLSAFEDSVIEPGDSGAGTLSVNGNMTINQSQANPNGELNYDLDNSIAGTNDLLEVSGNLNLLANGAVGGGDFKVNITPVNGNLQGGAYKIMTGNTAGSTATAADFVVSLVNESGAALNSRQNSIVSINANDVTVTFAPAQSSNWTGAANNTWAIGSNLNWSSSDNLFFDLDDVSFGDGTAKTSINITGPVNPGSMTFNNTVDTYTFTGSGIQGSGAMNLNPGANVILANNLNGFTGGTNIVNGATLTLGDGTGNTGQLAGGSSVVNDGTLAYNRGVYSFNTQIISGAGTITNNSGFTDMAGQNTYSGGTTVNGGTIRVRNPLAAGTGGITVNNGGAFETGYFSNQSFSKAVTLNDGSTLSVTNPSDSFVTAENSGQITWTGPVTLGGTGGEIRTTAGDGIVPGMTVAGGVVGTGDLSLTAEGDTLMIVNSPLSHSGNTSVGGGGTVALQTGATLNSAQVSVNAGSTLDISGFNGGTLVLSGQNVNGFDAAQVTGNVTTAANSTIRIGGVAAGLPVVSTGLQLNYDAAQDTPDDNTWDDAETSPGDVNITFSNGNASPSAVNDPTFTALTAAYDIATTGGAFSSGSDNGFFDFRAQSNGTFEFAFNITNAAAGNQQVLLDVGATRGVSLVLDGDVLSAGVNGDAATTTGFSTGSLSTGWHHAVMVIEDTDPANGLDDSFSLYVDNVLVGTSNSLDIDDWAGGNGWGIGGDLLTLDPTNGTNQTLGSPIDFHGQIAFAKYYQAALTSDDVNTNYLALLDAPFVGVDTFTVTGDLTLDSTAILEMDVHSVLVGSDLLKVLGQLTAGGTLEISAANASDLVDGDTFDLLDFGSLTGVFDTVNLPTLSAGLTWDTSGLLLDGVISVMAGGLVGDLDGDGFVGINDLNIVLGNWNQNVPPADPLADPSGDGFVGIDDLNAVLGNWNAGTPPTSNASIPEPASLALLGLGGLTILRRRH